MAVSASFPQSEIFGVKLVNGLTTESILSFTNNEPAPITVVVIGGSLWSPDFGEQQPSKLLRNLTASPFKSTIPAGESETFSYRFATEMHPADLILKLAGIVTDEKNTFYTLHAFEGDVSVVEKPTSIFDPQMWAYLCQTRG